MKSQKKKRHQQVKLKSRLFQSPSAPQSRRTISSTRWTRGMSHRARIRAPGRWVREMSVGGQAQGHWGKPHRAPEAMGRTVALTFRAFSSEKQHDPSFCQKRVVPSHTSQDGYYSKNKKQKLTSVARIWRNQSPCAQWWDVKTALETVCFPVHTGKQYGQSLKNQQQNWIYTPKELKAETQRDICAPVLIAALFTISQRVGATQMSINR